MKRVMGFLFIYKKWIWVLVYLSAFLIAWRQRDTIYCDIPAPFRETLLGDMFLDLIFFSLAFVGFVSLVQMLRCPFFQKQRFQKAFERVGLRNSLGEYPVLVSKGTDTHRKHGIVYTLDNKGISIGEFDDKNAKLEAALNEVIYCIEYGKKAQKMLLYAIPHKHSKPSVISAHDDYLTRDLMNLLCVGRTGSGKSHALLVILASIAKFMPNVSITICDYKKSSFAQFEDTPNFYGYEDVPDGIRAFYNEFSERLEANDEQRNSHKRVLLIDEYGALISAQDKKQADELKTMVANMLFMSRSLGMIILIGVQRADAEHFKGGSRDQFKAILGLSNLSKEQKQMVFADYKEAMTANNGLGEGYLLIDGQGIERVRVAPVKDFESLNDTIRQAMYH